MRKIILFDARGITPKPCGVRNVAENYLNILSKNFKVYALANEAMVSSLNKYDIDIFITPKFCSRFNLLSDIWVTYVSLKTKSNIFFSAHSFLPVFALLPNVKIFICHDLFSVFDQNFFNKRGLLSPLARCFFRLITEVSFFRASVVIAPSFAIAESFENLWVRAKKIIVVHNGISVDSIPDYNLLREKQMIFVGNFRSYKGFDILIKAWVSFLLLPESKDWILKVVTNETKESIKKFINSNNCERVEFYSRISDCELDEIRAKSAISIIPSRFEGFGMPLLESIVYGNYVVYSNIKVFAELIKGLNSEQFCKFHLDDTNDLIEKLSYFSGRFNQAGVSPSDKSIQYQNLEFVKENYSWITLLDQVIEEIKKVS